LINSDVQLFWANDENGNIAIIFDMVEEDRNKKYTCPVCGSEVRPVVPGGKTKDGKVAQVSSHFSHFDASKCNSETAVHWWFKNKILINGDGFVVKTDVENEYKCKEVLIEQSYNTEFGIYRPDITIITECDKTIYFEMNYTNKKKIEDYIDKWLKLGNPVVEVDLKTLMNASFNKSTYEFKALFYNGKCFNTKSDLYYDTIGLFKEKMYKSNIVNINDNLKERIKKLDWFWMDIIKYNKGEKQISDIVVDIDNIDDKDSKEVVVEILRKPKCSNIIKEYVDYKFKNIEQIIDKYSNKFNNIGIELSYDLHIPNRIYDRIYYGINAEVDLSCNYRIYDEAVIYGKEQKLIDKIERTLKNKTIYIISNKLVDELNNLYNYDSVVKNISKINNVRFEIKDSYYNGDVCLRFNNTDRPIKIQDINNLNEDAVTNEVYKMVNEYIINPFTKEKIIELDTLTFDINNAFSERDKSWDIDSYINYNQFRLSLILNSQGKTSVYSKIELKNNNLYIDETIVDSFNCDNINYNDLKLTIIERFNNSIENTIPLNNDIIETLEILKDYHPNLEYFINSPTKIKLILKYFEDVYVLMIENGDLYKNKNKICSILDKESSKIIEILENLFNAHIYIDIVEISENKYITLTHELNSRFSKIDKGNWRVGYQLNDNNFNISLINKYNFAIETLEFKNDGLDNLIEMQTSIANKFSESIRKSKYNKIGGGIIG